MPRQDYDSLVEKIKENDGICRFEMWQIRNAHGMSKLGVRMIKDIEAELLRRNIAHIPRELPSDDQNRFALFYSKDSEIGQVIDAARKAALSSRECRVMTKAAKAMVDSHKLAQVRRIVEEDE